VTITDVVGWVVFSISTFLACIVTAVIVVAVVASQKRRNKKPVTGVLVLFLNFRLKPKSHLLHSQHGVYSHCKNQILRDLHIHSPAEMLDLTSWLIVPCSYIRLQQMQVKPVKQNGRYTF